MKQKKVKLTKETLHEFFDKYKDKYITILDGAEIEGYWLEQHTGKKRGILDCKKSNNLVSKINNNTLLLEDNYRDGVILYLDKPVYILVDDYEAQFKMRYNSYDEAYQDLVPNYGPAYCKAGEIIRAYGNLSYAFYNNGDKVGCDCGGNHRAYEAGDILYKLVDDKIFQERLAKLYNTYRDDYYEKNLNQMEEILLDYINDNVELYEITK